MTNSITIEISSDAWLRNNYMNFPGQKKTFFPDDCFIARGTGTENKFLLDARGIDIRYQFSPEPVRCHMEQRAGTQFRPSNRGAIRIFYEKTQAKMGDSIVIKKILDRTFEISLQPLM